MTNRIDDMHFKDIATGFEYGAVKVTRLFSDQKKGWVTIGIETPKHKGSRTLQIYVTKTGKVRVFGDGEWIEDEPVR